ncbi:MAG TPA: aminoacyl-histidine dipeptidase [Thermoanaerobaculia bacterium]|nr:aminoacyl-histidine dipeptidase [Thermoanaerobaculia bacterium]
MTFVAELEPHALWQHFDDLLTIPRPSKHEEKARDYVIAVAERKGLRHREDAIGNVVVLKPASPGKEGSPAVMLQAHLDMVTEKNAGTVHDFFKDPILPRRDGDWVKATGTTLGADNGIGAATLLAVLDSDDLVHGPLELLFTVDEETGLTGALDLDPAALDLKGRILLNLDSEEEGTVTVGCAGGSTSLLTLPLESAPSPKGTATLDVKLSGLKGGHSGMEIHLQRGNASKLLARVLFAAAQQTPFHLASFSGGNKHNALPREAAAQVVVPTASRDAFQIAAEQEIAAIAAEIRPADPDVKLEIAEIADASAPRRAWTVAASRRALDLVNALPHGVLTMSYDIPGLVETSTNLATVTSTEDSLSILLSTRSSVASAMGSTKRRLRSIAELAGAGIEETEGYPGWKPDLASPLLDRFQQVHRRLTGKDAEVIAIHAGLECGILREKFPEMLAISFGPIIRGAHSPDEGVKIDSVGRFWELLKAVLAELAAAT